MVKSIEEQRHAASIFFVKRNDNGGIQLIGETLDTQESVLLTVNVKAYNKEKREWVDDKEVFEKGEARLKDLGATSVETAEADLNAIIAASGDLILDEIYVDDDRQSFSPIKEFSNTKGVEITPALVKSIKAAAKEGKTFETLPIEEFSGYRFNVFADFEGKPVRISQFVYIDEYGDEDESLSAISLKYTNKKIDGLRKSIEEDDLSEANVTRLKRTVEKLVEQSRVEKIKELSDVFGQDFEKMIEDKVVLEGKLFTKKFGDDVYYATFGLSVDEADSVEDEADSVEDEE